MNTTLLTLALFENFSWAQFGQNALFVLFIFSCLLLVLAVLIQKPQGGGLASAFGSGAGSGQTAFGTRTGDALTWITISCFVLYVGLAIGLNYAVKPAKAAAGTTPTAEAAPDRPANPPGPVPVRDVVNPNRVAPGNPVPPGTATPAPATPTPAPTEPVTPPTTMPASPEPAPSTAPASSPSATPTTPAPATNP